ncbi:hypothetical protein MNV49_000042 [Pseudohyphozyma bogoriensis]|nr:hypothetical protein MNV49_000042 [Pseudohyphozyma bogoriensis]
MHLTLIVYDLLPPSKLGASLNFIGAGEREWAFGGHYQEGTSGIFCIPARTAQERMGPQLRYYMEVDAGEIFGKDWEREFGPKRRRTAERPKSGGPYQQMDGQASSSSRLTLASEDENPFKDPGGELESDELSWIEDDGGDSDGTAWMTKHERMAFRIIETMRKDTEAWGGTKYQTAITLPTSSATD